MTRLDSDKVDWVSENLDVVDSDLQDLTGLSFREVCSGAGFFDVGFDEEDIEVAVVPLTTGEGEISGFSECVSEVLDFLGFESSVLDNDVCGLSQSVSMGFDGVFLADDDSFVGIDLDNRIVRDNDSSTARGFSIVVRSLVEREDVSSCLLVGLGNIGSGILDYLFESVLSIDGLFDSFYVYDINEDKVEACLSDYPVLRFSSDVIEEIDLVIDATPAISDVVYCDEFIKNDVFFVLPGVPAGSYPIDRGFHDPLALGTGTLAYMTFSSDLNKKH